MQRDSYFVTGLRVWAGVMAFLLLQLCSGPAFAAPSPRPQGSLTGQVLGPDQKPVPGARIMLQVSDGSRPHTVRTDARGHFRFPSLRHGNYDIRAQAKCQSSEWEHNVLVRSGRETRLTLRLVKQSPVNLPATPAKLKPQQ